MIKGENSDHRCLLHIWHQMMMMMIKSNHESINVFRANYLNGCLDCYSFNLQAFAVLSKSLVNAF